MKFYETPEFKELNARWRKKLERRKFYDHEDDRERLKQPNNRTIGFENQEAVSAFFSGLGEFLATHRIPRRDRMILSRFHAGMWIKDIAADIGVSIRTVSRTIKKYDRFCTSIDSEDRGSE